MGTICAGSSTGGRFHPHLLCLLRSLLGLDGRYGTVDLSEPVFDGFRAGIINSHCGGAADFVGFVVCIGVMLAMKPKTTTDEGQNEEGLAKFQARLSRLGQIEVPLWPFRWMGMAVLFVVGAVVCGVAMLYSFAFFGGVYALVVGLVLCIFPNRYLRALGFGLLAPLLLVALHLLVWKLKHG